MELPIEKAVKVYHKEGIAAYPLKSLIYRSIISYTKVYCEYLSISKEINSTKDIQLPSETIPQDIRDRLSIVMNKQLLLYTTILISSVHKKESELSAKDVIEKIKELFTLEKLLYQGGIHRNYMLSEPTYPTKVVAINDRVFKIPCGYNLLIPELLSDLLYNLNSLSNKPPTHEEFEELMNNILGINFLTFLYWGVEKENYQVIFNKQNYDRAQVF